jgi:hypothetical protein
MVKNTATTNDNRISGIWLDVSVSTKFHRMIVSSLSHVNVDSYTNNDILLSDCFFDSCDVSIASYGNRKIMSNCRLEGGRVWGNFSTGDESVPVVYKTNISNVKNSEEPTAQGVYLYECTGFECDHGFAEKSDLLYANYSDYYGIWECDVQCKVTEMRSSFYFAGPVVDSSFNFSYSKDSNNTVFQWSPLLDDTIDFFNNSFEISVPSRNSYYEPLSYYTRLFDCVYNTKNLVSHNNKVNAKIKPYTLEQSCHVAICPQSVYGNSYDNDYTLPVFDFNIEIDSVSGVFDEVVWFMYGTPIKSQSTVSYRYALPQGNEEDYAESVYEFLKSNGSDISVCGTVGSGHFYEFYEDGSYVKHDETWDGKTHAVTITEKEIKHDGPDGTVITTETYTEPLCD